MILAPGDSVGEATFMGPPQRSGVQAHWPKTPHVVSARIVMHGTATGLKSNAAKAETRASREQVRPTVIRLQTPESYSLRFDLLSLSWWCVCLHASVANWTVIFL